MTNHNHSQSLSREAVLAVDSAAQIDDVLAIPDHIEDALWRAESAMLAPAAQPASALVVCGVGGSAIGSDLAVALAGDRVTRPVCVTRGYDLPSWADTATAVLCSSYSGNTEETLSCYEQAAALGAPLYVVSSGGLISESAHATGVPVIGLPGILQPRCAVAYGMVGTIEVGIAAGVFEPSIRSELAAAAAPLRELAAQWGPDGDEDALPKRLARAAGERLTVTYGAQLTAPAAYRWRCQINENAKQPAAHAELPESNHNEVCGWGEATAPVPEVAWLLRDADQHPRVRERIEITAQIAADAGASAEIVDTIGDSPASRLFSAVLLGDLVSLYMAVLRGIDPTPVPVIENLKDRLGRPATA
ncbi:MAG: bifunctional phosphoglucose/phosphomannose isomerase [Actinobacteria bacterium]|nr:bifunctional phosphoglucose/phosphomannose isomerase [Actinomycetota bacterium]